MVKGGKLAVGEGWFTDPPTVDELSDNAWAVAFKLGAESVLTTGDRLRDDWECFDAWQPAKFRAWVVVRLSDHVVIWSGSTVGGELQVDVSKLGLTEPTEVYALEITVGRKRQVSDAVEAIPGNVCGFDFGE